MLKAKISPQTWDYIIVGAGSAGCLLANRLIRAGFSVLLIEAGKQDKGFWLHLPVGYFKTIFDEKNAFKLALFLKLKHLKIFLNSSCVLLQLLSLII